MNTYAITTQNNTIFRHVVKAPNARTVVKAINLGLCLPVVKRYTPKLLVVPCSNQQEPTDNIIDDCLIEKLQNYPNSPEYWEDKARAQKGEFRGQNDLSFNMDTLGGINGGGYLDLFN